LHRRFPVAAGAQIVGLPGCDGVIALTHDLGCAMAEGTPGDELLRRTLRGYAVHPNLAGVIVVTLGCEVNQPANFLTGSAAQVAHLSIQELGGTNAPMFRGNFYAVEGADMPSDQATGFSSVHPDEEGGNEDGHHSFKVVFQDTLAAGDGIQTGAVRGTISNGANLTVTLTGANINRSATVGGNDSFSFDNVPPGTYDLAVTGTSVASSVVVIAGQTATATLTAPKKAASLISPVGPRPNRLPRPNTNCERQTSSRP